MTHRFTPGEGDETPMREWEADGPDLTTKAVCIECNNHWLSELETKASPVVRGLILGEQCSLTSMEQRTVATWSYKTTLLFQLVRAKTARAIPRERFRELYLRERPPSDVRIWLASAKANNAMHETSTEINLANTRHQVPGFFAAIALGHLLVLCAGRLFSGEEQLRIGSGVNLDTTVEIWPASVRPAPWPPPIPLEDLQAKTLVQML